jgi:hypothetical protein
VELQCVHSGLALTNSKNPLSENKTDHTLLSWLHNLSKNVGVGIVENHKHETKFFFKLTHVEQISDYGENSLKVKLR